MKYFLIVVGSLCVVFAVVGIFVPVLPTTPFLLLAAALYFRASPKLYDWLVGHKVLGTYIRNYREHGKMPLHAKVIALLMMWGSIMYCIVEVIPYLLVDMLLLLVLIFVSRHILGLES